MAMRKHPARFRAIRPAAENLEQRQLLSGTVSGIDSAGDAWTLTLVGPGSLKVTKQPDANGNPTGLMDPSNINAITVYGTDPKASRLVGTVVPSGQGNGEVFFQNLTEVSNPSEKGGGLGLLAVDMPQFYLGLTASAAPSGTGATEPGISIPDGVDTLYIGGIDTTAFFGTDASKSLSGGNQTGSGTSATGQNNQFTVNLGLPEYGGTRIILNKIVTNSYQVTPSGSTTPTTFQNGVTFQTTGRLELFQANEIDGSTINQPQFFTTTQGSNSTGISTNGGVIVEALGITSAAITGQVGFVKVGGNATNFSVVTSDRINTYFVGGETNNINILANGGTRNLYFGKGMDTATIRTHTIQRLFANRGAINSTVISDRQIGNMEFGGDVIGTTIESGYNQSLSNVFSTTSAPSLPAPTADAGGQMRVTVAGNITNSVFASSVEPGSSGYGSADDLRLPLGTISARVQGTINNSTATPQSPTSAFYAKAVKIIKGPVVPPTVPEAPYGSPNTPTVLPGIHHPYAYAYGRGNRVNARGTSGNAGSSLGTAAGSGTNQSASGTSA